MVAEVRLAQGEQPGDGGLQVVVHPQPAHRVVGGGVDAHRDRVGVLAGDALVHVEQVPVAGLDRLGAEAVDGGGEVQVDAVAQRPDAATLVDDGLGVARGDVAWHQVAERGVLALQEVVAVALGDVAGRALLVEVGRGPDAAVVAQRLRHQGQLRLELVGRRDAGRVDLRVAGVGERRALLVGPPGRGHVAGLGVGRQEVDVAVPAGAQQHGVGRVGAHLAGEQVAGDDALRPVRRGRRRPGHPCGCRAARCRGGSGAPSPGRRRAAAAGRSGPGRRTCGPPGRRRTSGCRAGRRTRGRRAHPAPWPGR